ncbi:hypothetical protein IJ732_02775 [bacterium]|nr:hypothetical protein [bacterium]
MLNNLFPYFSKQQKSALCHSIKSFVKKNIEKNDLFNLFIEQELYYLEIDSSRLLFIKNYLNDEKFLKELKLYFAQCLRYYDYQKKLEPFKQAQKIVAKEQRKKISEYKMSKEPPTKRQLSYYKSLCKKYEIEMLAAESLSKLDLRNMISEIKNEHQTD